MRITKPRRSLVQIKSHAQKVLKRLDAGENIFRRLEENYREIDNLVVQAARQRDALREAGINVNTTVPPKSLPLAAKRKRQVNRSQKVDFKDGEECSPSHKGANVVSEMKADGEVESGQAVIAAAALCQLSSLAAPWEQHGVIDPIEQQLDV